MNKKSLSIDEKNICLENDFVIRRLYPEVKEHGYLAKETIRP